ncbi:MAG: RNase H-like domain-containing protein, partial [Dehalococcoidia bacterium]|nr:RNase H-like domain-containing protein [Dehalococcoidia bacterium]
PGYKVELAVSFDASEIGAGATLWQRAVWSAEKPHEVLRPLDGSWHPLEFYSHKWSASERRRNVTEKECLALVLGTRSWWRYLTGRRFVVFTDHRNLIFMRASSNRKVIRWDSEMSEFNFEVYHVPGDTNVLPDFLSRCGHPTLEELPAGRLGKGTMTAVVTRSQVQVEDVSPPVATGDPLGGPEPDDPLPWIHELSQALGSGMEQPELEVVQRRGFTMVDGLWRDSEGLVYIPEGGRSSALVGAHEMAGHFGVPRVVRLLKEAGVTWPGIVEDVKRHVASCPACQLVKADGRLPDGPQQTPEFRTEGVLALGWELDVAGPINPHSEEGYTHILMCVEVGYRYVELIPIRAPVTAVNLMKSFCNRVVFHYGPPVLVKSDGARNLDSAVAEELFRLLHAKHHIGTPHRPQSQGRAERHIGVMMKVVRATLMQCGGDWAEILPQVQWCMNTAHSSVTGFSPYQMMFGSPPCTTLSLITRMQEAEQQYRARVALDPEDWVAQLVTRTKTLVQAFKENQSRAMSKERANARRPAWPKFMVGDVVMVFFHQVLGKLDTHWRGPFRVIECGDLHVYRVALVEDPRRSYRAHVERLRPFDASRMLQPGLQRRIMLKTRYLLESVLDVKETEDGPHALVRWAGFEEEDATWEPVRLVQDTEAYKTYCKLASLRGV